MSIQWFHLHGVLWEGLDLRSTHFHFGITHATLAAGGNRYTLGLCSPDYEGSCITLGAYAELEEAQTAAEQLTAIIHAAPFLD